MPQWNSFSSSEMDQFIDPGSHSTFHGIIAELSSEDTPVIASYRRGDATAIWIDDDSGSLVLADPEPIFTNYPKTLGVKDDKFPWSGFHVKYECLPARCLLLATDKLAEFLIDSFSVPNKDLLNQLENLDQLQFDRWCEDQQRHGLKPDDYSLVLLMFSEDLPIDPQVRPSAPSESEHGAS
jgi:hypothetical protein